MSDFWVFGYGSLMWRPGFPYVEQSPAVLRGAHRALCVYSWVHRGTRERPGLVLGLDRGGACRGVAYRVAAADRDAVMRYLRERELVTDVYVEVERPVELPSVALPAGPVKAVAYLVDRAHEQYAGLLPREELLRLVKDSVGRSGTNADYVVSTVAHMLSAGIRDATLEWLADSLK
jgi:glutathione-specific gamma-glutamylcyclotransferase